MTKQYLQRSAFSSFFLFLLGIPVMIWIYSISVELNKRMPKERRLNINILRFMLGSIGFYFIIFVFGIIDPFKLRWLHDIIITFNFLSFVFTVVIITRFEQTHSIQPTSGLLFFFQLAIAPIGVFYLQPLMNEYICYPKIEN